MKPNFVFIMCDQLRKDCIGGYGNEFINTPNIDRLIENGTAFENAYVANPICMPNRNSIISGRMPSNHGVYTNGLLVEDCGKTVTAELKKLGYKTANIGKMHLNPCKKESAGISFESNGSWKEIPQTDAYTKGYFGYDHVELTIGHTEPCAHYYKWFKDNGGTDDMFDVISFESGKRVKSGENLTGIRMMPGKLSSSEFVGERVSKYIEDYSDDNPFLITASFPDPHQPFTSCFDDYEKIVSRKYKQPIGEVKDLKTRPISYMQKYTGEWTRKGIGEPKTPNGISEFLKHERILHTYAMIERIDENIGKIIASVEKAGKADNTIFVFTADHGELLGDHGLWLKGPFYYDGLMNVPMIFSGCGVDVKITDAMFSSIDIAPTMLAFAGGEIPKYIDGVSHKDFLQGEKEAREVAFIEYRNGYGDADVNSNAIVTKKYKYIAYENGERELTDRRNDIKEENNVAFCEEYSKIRLEMAELLITEKLKYKTKGEIQYGLA